MEAEILPGRFRPTTTPPTVVTAVADYVQHLRTERRAKKTLQKYQAVFDRVVKLAERRHVRGVDGLGMKFMEEYRTGRVDAGAAPKTVYG